MILKTKKTDKGVSLKIEIFGFYFVFSIVSNKGKAYTTGIRNITEDNKRVLFLDYDRQSLDLIVAELVNLQIAYKLGDFYLFESSNNSYHAVCFDELDFLEWLEILKKTSCDSVYRNVPYFAESPSNVLRVVDKGEKGKPRFLSIVRSLTGYRQMDRAIFNFFKDWFDIPYYYDDSNFNKSEKIIKVDYLTLNK